MAAERRVPRHADVLPRVKQTLEFVELGGTLKKFPSELSGGMRRRAAIARAVVTEPPLQMYDSPTAGLDPISANEFDVLIRELQKSLRLTVFMVTHDIDTLRATTDRIAVLVDNRIKVGTMTSLTQDPHPWIHEYFTGVRARPAVAQ